MKISPVKAEFSHANRWQCLEGCLYINYYAINRPLSLTPLTSSAMMTPENTEEDPDDPEPVYGKIIKIEYSSSWMYSSSTGAVT